MTTEDVKVMKYSNERKIVLSDYQVTTMVKLFIGNLPDGMLATNDDVRPLFEQFGNVGECEVIRNYG